MQTIFLFVKKRWLIFLIILTVLLLTIYKISEQKKAYYKAESSIIFIGKEGTFSPELEARRLREEGFLKQACSRIKGYSIAYIADNLELKFKQYGALSISFVSEDPKMARDIVNLLSGNFIEERKRTVEESTRKEQDILKSLSDDILHLEANLSVSEKNLRELKQKHLGSDQRRKDISIQVEETKIAYQQLSRIFTDQHPDVASAKNKIDILESRLEEIPDMGSEYSRFEKIIESERSKLKLKKNEYQKIYDQLKTQPEPWRVELAKDAAIPKEPIGVSRQLYYSLSIGSSFFAVLMFCLLLELADNRIHTKEEAEIKLGIPVIADIGKIPTIKTAKKNMHGLTKKLISNVSPISAIKKIEQIYTYLKVDTFKGDISNKSILITSADPKSGKSFMAYNLALICAKNGEKVLLVDANFHNPALSAIFNLDRHAAGFSDLLRGSSTQKESIRNMTDLLLSGTLKLKDKHIAGLDHLKLLLSGSKVENPFSLLGLGEVKELFKELSEKYGMLIIDSAGIKQYPDVLNLVSVVDCALLVVRKHRSKYPVLKEVVKKIQSIKIHYMGIILANV